MAATKRDFILSSGIGLSADNIYTISSTNSTSIDSGTVIVAGGVGIGASVSIGGRLQMFNGANYTAFVSSATGNTVYTLPATSPATGTSVLQSTSAGVLSWVPMTATAGASSGNTAQNIVVNSAENASAFHPILFTPSSLSAGSAVSSDGTISFNPSTEILNVSGLAITAITASTSTANGALQVAGGVGISGRLSFNQASFGTTGIATNPTMAMIGTTGDPIYMSVLEDNSISFEGTQGQLFSITPNLSTGYIYSVNDITGIPLLRANANANVTANEYAGNFGIGLTNPGYKLHVLGSVGFTSTTASTSTTTGTLVVSGGVGIGGSIFGASTISAADNIEIKSGKELRLNNSGNTFYTGIKAGSNTSNTTYTFPAAFPGAGTSVLQSDTSGTLSWVGIVGNATTAQNIVVNAAGNANVFHSVLFTPSSLSAGSAVSSDGTISFNPSTEILNVSGLAITSGTASTNTTTGALVVRGGLGVTGQLSFATASFGFTGITTNPTMSFIGATSSSPITLTILTDNSLNWEGSQGSVFSIDSNLSTGEIFSVSDISGLPIISASAGQTVTFNEFGGYTQFGNGSINSSSTTTGALVVSGGVGITGNANIGGTVRLTNTTASTSSTTGAMTVSGGVGIGGSVSIAGRLQLFNSSNFTAFVSSATGNTVYTLPATSPATGSSVLQSTSAGVMSWVPMTSGSSSGTVNSGTANFAAYYASTSTAVSENANLQFTGTGLSVGGNINSTSTKSGALYVNGGLGVTGNAFIGGTTTIQSSVASISSSTGALVVSGGAGIAQSISVGGRLQLFNSSNYTAFVSAASGNTTYTLPATSPATGTSYLTSNSSGVMSWTAPNKANYVLSFGAGFTPTADSADSVSLNVPYLPDGTLKYYYIKRIEYRNETLSGGTGLSFYLQRHTTGNASWNTTNTITAGSGASFYIGPSVYASSFTTIASSAGVAGSVVSGDYLRLFFTGVGSAANLSIAMTIEEQ
jgi:filamentous hemagglutinin